MPLFESARKVLAYRHLMTERVSEAVNLYDPMPETSILRKVDER